MVQAIKPSTTGRPSTRAAAVAGTDASVGVDGELFAALAALIGHLKRRTNDPETGARTFLLHQVDRHAPVRASDLAELSGHDASTISRHLRTLEDSGLVLRSPDPDDRRASLLTVTPDGRAFLDHAVRVRTALLAEATATWDADDVATLTRLLHHLATDLENL